jgi:glycine dehydrogenase subunit 1
MGYISNTGDDIRAMLDCIGVESLDDLFSDIPPELRFHGRLNLPESLSGIELDAHLRQLAQKNILRESFTGAGSYRHYIPAVVDHLSSRSEFYTAYTPYQPEVSQGTLTAIFEYQTMICRLTGMDVSNAGLYDGATSLAESVLLSSRMNGRKKVLICDSVHPHYRDVLKTYAWANGLTVETVPHKAGLFDPDRVEHAADEMTTAVVAQNPNFFGSLEGMDQLAESAHRKGAFFIYLVTEPLSLGLLKTPRSLGADIVCGEAGSFGNPPGLGGPCLGLLAVKEPFLRKIPGRIAGRTEDADGKEAYVLTLQTREQHIRRDQATSNICTNEALCALRAVIYLSHVGNQIRPLAQLNHTLASYLKNGLHRKGLPSVFSSPYFNEFAVKVPSAEKLTEKLNSQGIQFGIDLGRWYPEYRDCLLVACTECTPPDLIDRVLECL